MAMREIIKLPDKRLRLVSEPVKRVDAGIRKLVEDMFESQYDAPGIGLAAIQVGVAKRVVTVDLSKKEEAHEPRVFINPEITWTSEEKATYGEGCLSIPEVCEEVERPVQVKVKYLDLDGGGWRVRPLSPARDRPHQRRTVHRPPLQAQARPRHQEIQQGGEEEGGGGDCRPENWPS
jgi:peptide deformylase